MADPVAEQLARSASQLNALVNSHASSSGVVGFDLRQLSSLVLILVYGAGDPGWRLGRGAREHVGAARGQLDYDVMEG